MKSFYILFIFALLTQQVSAQPKRNQEWLAGHYAIVANISQSGVAFDTTLMTLNASYTGVLLPYSHGKSSICDTTGKMLLLSDGFNLLNRQGYYIEGGDSLLPYAFMNLHGWYSPGHPQYSIILPMEREIYYLFTPGSSDSMINVTIQTGYGSFDQMYAHKVDMKLNGGAGKVVQPKQLVAQKLNQSFSQMMACRHANGKDWWLLRMGADTIQVYTYLVTQDSVYYKGVQKLPHILYTRWDNRGQSTFSNDGTRYASLQNFNNNTLILADFDRCTGILSKSQQLSLPLVPAWWGTMDSSLTGICFSPNDSFLYVSRTSHIYQYEFATNSWFTIHGPDTTNVEFSGYTTIYRGNDDKLYIGNWGGINRQMSVIENPNGKGQSCNFCRKCLRNEAVAGFLGSPATAPNYHLGAEPCWPLQNEHVKEKENEWIVYPNPASSKLVVKSEKRIDKIELYNAVGQLVLSTKEHEIDVSRLSKGVYYIKCAGVSKKVIIE